MSTLGGMPAVDVLLVDDDAEFRAAARDVLGASGFVVSREATSGCEAVGAVAAKRPDLVLVDIQLPDIDGFELASRLLARPGPPVVVLISTRDASDYGRRISESGVAGFLTKARLSGARLRAILWPSREA